MINPIDSILRVLVAVLVLFLIGPFLLVTVFSFSDNPLSTFPLGEISLVWWREMLAHPRFYDALANSLIIAASVGTISAIIGTMAAISFAKMSNRRATTLISILCLPMMMPPLVLAVSLLSYYNALGVPLNLFTVIASHLLFTMPFVVLVTYARLATFDFTAVESARDLGATPLVAFVTITLPMIRPTIIGASLIATALSIDDFIITFFTIGQGNTLPTLVWGMIRTQLTPSVNAIGTVLIMISICSAFVALRLTKYRA
ncbi:MAG: ABC transporter permease [Amylibacter sp.]|jgi:spermidine/putrescine transport system permease protein|tara:strand:- start:5152 stop:5928 length:777 start_codon:yes stop_codon:yes gene_type:complete